jgi:hypothetical protein
MPGNVDAGRSRSRVLRAAQDNVVQFFGLSNVLVAGGNPILTKDVGKHIRYLRFAEIAGVIGWHGGDNNTVELAGDLAVPFPPKPVARQCWGTVTAPQMASVAALTLGCIDNRSAFRLKGGEEAG